MKVDSVPKKTTSMTMNLWPLPTSPGDRHLPQQLKPSSLCPKGLLILRCPMRPPLSVLASLAALHLSSRASTKGRGPRTQLRGVLRRVLCQCRVTSQAASNSLALSRLPIPTLRAEVVTAVSERRSPQSGVTHLLPLGLVPIPLSYLRRSRARRHATPFSMPSNLLLLCQRARPSQKSSMLMHLG